MLREHVVDRNERPERPSMAKAPQLSDKVWTVMQLCWQAEPTSRPAADAIRNMLPSFPPSSLAPSSVGEEFIGDWEDPLTDDDSFEDLDGGTFISEPSGKPWRPVPNKGGDNTRKRTWFRFRFKLL